MSGRLRATLVGWAVGGALAVGSAPAGAIEVVAQDVSASSGISATAHTSPTTVADWNNDDWDDAFVLHHFDRFPRLLLNNGGGFDDMTAVAFPTGARRDYHDCPTADVDGNGRLDLYCSVGGGGGGTGAHPNELWLQNAAGVFIERAADWRVQDRFGRGRQATFIDANADAFPDLYVSNVYPRADGRRGPNRLFVNVGGERFRNAPEFGLNGQIGGKEVQAADFNGDGREDLLVCGEARMLLYRNVGNRRFKDVARRVGAPKKCRDAALVRMNGDNRLDLVVIAKRLQVLLQGRRGTLRRKPALQRSARAAASLATGDVNADGVPDIYLVRTNPYNPDLAPEAQVDVRDLMLVSAGSPRSYSRLAIPDSSVGLGDDVAAIDHDRNGLSDFIVLNGRFHALGPIRLVAFYPASGG